MTKNINKRSTSPAIQDRDHQLAAEANEWAREQVRKWFDEHPIGFYTAADILQALDERQDAPMAWVRWLSNYPTRYHMVRNPLAALAKREYLETRQEINALNKPATAYQRARDLDDWTVVVEGGEEDSVTDLVTGWLRENKRALKSVRTIAITRTGSSRSEDHRHRPGAPGASAVQRQRG